MTTYIKTRKIIDKKAHRKYIRKALFNFLMSFITGMVALAFGEDLLGDSRLIAGGLLVGFSLIFLTDIIAATRGKDRLVEIEGDYTEKKIFA